MLHPESRALIDFMAAWNSANGVPPRHLQTPEQARDIFRRSAHLRAEGPVPVPEVAAISDHVLGTRAGPRPARLYRPKGADDAPTLVYVHGGGYVVGGIAESETETKRFAAGVPANVVSISYRLAPEHAWPAAVDDVEDQIAAILAGAIPGIRRDRLAVAGVSAGAGALAAATRRLVERGSRAIRLAVLLSPWLDCTLTSPSVDLFGVGHMLEKASLASYCKVYIPPGIAADHPELSPARHAVPAGWPRTILFAAGRDPLADDSVLFARRLAEAGIDHELMMIPGMLHGFNAWFTRLPALAPELTRLDRSIAAWAR